MTPVHFTVVTNFVLAIIPFILAIYLFRYSQKRNFFWWVLVPVFILFLPNSAYVLTDIIHFIAAVKSPNVSRSDLLLLYVPFYILFLSSTFEFYVLSVKWSHEYIQKFNVNWLSRVYVPSIHFLCALGVYLGRFQRLESAEIVSQPFIIFKDIGIDLTHLKSELIIFALFLIFYGLYNVVLGVNKRIMLSLLFQKIMHRGFNRDNAINS